MNERRTLFVDMGPFGGLLGHHGPNQIDMFWSDHGVGLLRTILKEAHVDTDIVSTRLCSNWTEFWPQLIGYDTIIMNVRSYRFGPAKMIARAFKDMNPDGIVLVGGMHASVAPEDMEAVEEFDHICKGPGEKVIVDLVKNPGDFPKIFDGPKSARMEDWPRMDRTLWPRPLPPSPQAATYPLEASCGWGPPPVATMITSRVCPWRCSFCSEASYIENMERRSVDSIIDELNWLDAEHGPLGSVVFHDSMFFQQPHWIKEFIEKYPTRARKPWPYWAAGRADTVRKWPDLFEALVRETNWTTVSIGFESGSDRVLETLNKECTAEDNAFAIDLLNEIGDDLESKGRERPRFWANIMFAVPGESREDAFRTMKMWRRMKNPIPTLAYYAPYAGSALGYQLMAEGKSLMEKDDHQRYAGQPKVKGVDYRFYDDLLRGRYEREIVETPFP
jgi:radical SAM superfamily enzyme YgiQ (UPF0313 family)